MILYNLEINQQKIYPINGIVNIGRNASLYCDGLSYQEWYHLKRKQDSNVIILEDPTPITYDKKLYIINASLTHGGSYICLGGPSNDRYFVAFATLKVYGT